MPPESGAPHWNLTKLEMHVETRNRFTQSPDDTRRERAVECSSHRFESIDGGRKCRSVQMISMKLQLKTQTKS